MCLAIPGKVLNIDHNSQPVMGTVSFGGIEKLICLEWLPDATVGDYVLVHVGFAISKMDEKEALETLKLFDDIEDAYKELGSNDDNAGNVQGHEKPST
jgi:hydrogenase expression/formation protein HypC